MYKAENDITLKSVNYSDLMVKIILENLLGVDWVDSKHWQEAFDKRMNQLALKSTAFQGYNYGLFPKSDSLIEVVKLGQGVDPNISLATVRFKLS